MLKVLHANHYLVLRVKKTLFDVLLLLDEAKDKAQRMERLKRIVQLGEDVLKVVEIIEPGFSLNR